jgi:hypothetical protein
MSPLLLSTTSSCRLTYTKPNTRVTRDKHKLMKRSGRDSPFAVHAPISHMHNVPRTIQPKDHYIPTEPHHHPEVRHRVEFEDLAISMTSRLRWTTNLFSSFFSSTRRLGGLAIADSAKSFLVSKQARTAKSHLSTPLKAYHTPSTHTHGSHSLSHSCTQPHSAAVTLVPDHSIADCTALPHTEPASLSAG